ncbi:hypothetical protein V1517DRAFT_376160 [Lipomyces orientalis]|uniref:Uncharacterized protein n=1 Tax=Lipomyces orientalis TaxID=1233043 RepID=A0ACC3TG45_9ASCO
MAPRVVPGLPDSVAHDDRKLSITCPVCDQLLTGVRGNQAEHEHRNRMRVRLLTHVNHKARKNDTGHQEFLNTYQANKASVKLPGTAAKVHRQVERNRMDQRRQIALEAEARAREEALRDADSDKYWQRYLEEPMQGAIKIAHKWLTNYCRNVPEVPPSPESTLVAPTKNMENLFFLLELVGLTPLAMLPTEEPYSSRELTNHVDRITRIWPWKGTFQQLVEKVTANISYSSDFDSRLTEQLRSAAKRSGNKRYRRDAAFKYVSYYAAYEDFRIDLARIAEQRDIRLARRAAWEEVKTNFPDHLVQTIVRWRKGEDLQTILETEYGK